MSQTSCFIFVDPNGGQRSAVPCGGSGSSLDPAPLREENMAVVASLCWLFMESVHPLCSAGGFWEVLDVSAAVTPLGGGLQGGRPTGF